MHMLMKTPIIHAVIQSQLAYHGVSTAKVQQICVWSGFHLQSAHLQTAFDFMCSM
jgi:hypothetical protein